MSTGSIYVDGGPRPQIERMYADVVAALGELSEVVADETATTPQFSYRYASLGSIMGKVRPVLASHQLALSQLVTAHDGLVSVATQLVHVSGQTFGAGALTMSAPAAPQSLGSLVTYLRRYQLMALLGLAVDDDDAAAAQPAPGAGGEHRGSSGEQRASDAQVAMIRARFRDLDMGDDDSQGDRLASVISIIGHDLDRPSQLTKSEASKVIDELGKMIDDLRASRSEIEYGR